MGSNSKKCGGINRHVSTLQTAESQMSPETNKLDDQRQDDVEPKRSLVERDAGDGNKGQNDTDEVQNTSDEALNSQTTGEESTAETGKNNPVRSETEPEREPSNRETLREEKDDGAGEPECERFGSHDKDDESDGEISHIRYMKTDENGTASEVENSEDAKAQDKLNVNQDRAHSSITQENTSNISEEVKKSEVDDASVNGKKKISQKPVNIWMKEEVIRTEILLYAKEYSIFSAVCVQTMQRMRDR
ncbi:bifunctional lysine-specific demethylase and histidyl-hydroxylase NO66-like [Sparus aurata]|uniref:bifunctional lysine-specific demethylase and histidyl-hydroxylase NO66-like n=1 Tax=Sparus aurata TaxID=8175 RepID=UPI0011C168C9|nr:bifunctional lysine-specific demethylase and histidyl-hydroxylase NO66-like [Sparus aurata]